MFPRDAFCRISAPQSFKNSRLSSFAAKVAEDHGAGGAAQLSPSARGEHREHVTEGCSGQQRLHSPRRLSRGNVFGSTALLRNAPASGRQAAPGTGFWSR